MAARYTKPGGGKPEKLIRDAMLNAIRQGPHKLKIAAERVLDAAAEGDLEAMKFMADRVDGKAVQPLANDYDNPLTQVSDDSIEPAILELIRKAGIIGAVTVQAQAANEGKPVVVH